MTWDLGPQGLGLLLLMAVGFGVVARLLARTTLSHGRWIAAVVVYAASGLFVSEVWFGWATKEDLQPNVDGLSFDEVLLLGTLLSVAFVVALRLALRSGALPARRHGRHLRHHGRHP